MGTPASSINACATGCAGMRTATVSSPPVVSRGIMSFFGKIIVSGPGQNASISFFALSGTSAAISYNPVSFAICAIRGLSEGRPFAA